jgi:hypothetical protein
MPNHVVNILTIEGSEELVAKIKSEISSIYEEEGEQHHLYIDFHKVAPLPEELKETTSPVKIISQEEYYKQEARIASGDLEEHEKRFGVSRGITKEMSVQFINKYGFNNWYDWQRNAWGTKWNAYNQEHLENGDIKFKTAWSTPARLIQTLSEKYPDATFKVRFADEDLGHNVGEYHMKAGDVIVENIPEGGSEDAYMMACEIRDEWDYIVARIEEMEEDDLGQRWAQMYINVAYNKSLFGDYQEFIWNYLEQLAVEEENYEMAQKIKEYLELVKA